MAGKIGEEYFKDMKDRGWRELGGALYPDSNIAQPMYPLRGSYGVSKDVESPGLEEHDRLKEAEVNRDDPGRDDPGIDRE